MVAASSLVQIGRAQKNARSTRHDDNVAKWQHLRPMNAQIYLENRCHLKCAHCYETAETHPPQEDGGLSLAEYERVFTDLKALGVMGLTLTGGEIFLRRDCLDIVALARRLRFGVILYTSGTLLDEDKADRIRDLLVSEVHISLYSHDADVHDAFTGVPRSHERTMRGLRLLQERGVRTVVKSNVMTFNVEHLDEMIALATSVGADYQFDPTVKPKMNGDRSPLLFAVPPEQLKRLIYMRPEFFSAFRRNEPGSYCTGEKSFLDDDSVMCGAARGVVSIGADGSVSACGFFPSSAGNVRSQPLADLWFGSDHMDMVRSTRMGEMTTCKSCDVKSTCSPCMAYAELEHGDHTGCATSSRQAAEAIRLLAESKVRKNAQMSVGRLLPIVGDLDVPRPPTKGLPALATE
jgi:radical SAM protein with 4Fe4S-binding SPASM domain